MLPREVAMMTPQRQGSVGGAPDTAACILLGEVAACGVEDGVALALVALALVAGVDTVVAVHVVAMLGCTDNTQAE